MKEGGFVRRTRGNTIHLRWSKEGFTSDGPDLDQRKATGATVRIFLSQKDDISCATIGGLNDPALTQDWRAENKAVRNSLAAALRQSATLPALSGDDATLTLEQALDAWLYGDLTHVQNRNEGRRRHERRLTS